jgi:hypothetical protein
MKNKGIFFEMNVLDEPLPTRRAVLAGNAPPIHLSSREALFKDDGSPTRTSSRGKERHFMAHHHLHSSPETCHWGFFEAKLNPVLTIDSGDEVTIDSISGGPDVVPDRNKFHVPPELFEVHARSERMVPGHILTGPIAVRGAEPGDVLEVDILDVPGRIGATT